MNPDVCPEILEILGLSQQYLENISENSSRSSFGNALKSFFLKILLGVQPGILPGFLRKILPVAPPINCSIVSSRIFPEAPPAILKIPSKTLPEILSEVSPSILPGNPP